jgi:hypothetical protein
VNATEFRGEAASIYFLIRRRKKDSKTHTKNRIYRRGVAWPEREKKEGSKAREDKSTPRNGK